MDTKMNLSQAIHVLKSKGFVVKGYGYPESDSLHSDSNIADQYRVLQGDYDTGMISPLDVVTLAKQIQRK